MRTPDGIERDRIHSLCMRTIRRTKGRDHVIDDIDISIQNQSLRLRHEAYEKKITNFEYLMEIDRILFSNGYGHVASPNESGALENHDPRIKRIYKRSAAIIINYNKRNGITESKDLNDLRLMSTELKNKTAFFLVTVEEYLEAINEFLKERGYREVDINNPREKRSPYLKPGLVIGDITLLKAIPSTMGRGNRDWLCMCGACGNKFISESVRLTRITDCGCVAIESRAKALEYSNEINAYPYNFYKKLYGKMDEISDYPKNPDPISHFSAMLSDTEKKVLTELYINKKTMAEIGALMGGCTRQNIDKFKTNALTKIASYKTELY